MPAWLWPGGSGPAVAGLYQRALALLFVVAWLSLAAQIRLLVGPRGLMPLADLVAELGRLPDLPLLAYPSIFRWRALTGDGVLLAGTLVGVALGVLAFVGFRPRLAFALSTALYLSYACAARTFLAFQWDNLLLECGLLAVFLPADRARPAVHLLFRLLLFKLYFESGIAKWQSPLGDWHDGSAMTYYFETAPLPTWLAWHLHALPEWWHRIESWATLLLELALPLAIFGPRRFRLFAAASFTAFQVVNAATANYGFFCHLAVALHLFLLDDEDVLRLRAALRLAATPPSAPPVAAPSQWRRGLGAVGVASYVVLSLLDAAVHFGDGGRWMAAVAPLRALYEPLRLVNTYHLFASITRERIEPVFETRTEGVWRQEHLHYKPGDPARPPGFVAPHQPRVDFQLWFYGLSYESSEPLYVTNLARRLCSDPAAVSALFREPLPRAPEAVRISYWQYTFTTPPERRERGAFWARTLRTTTAPFACMR